jgi:hypothetical protein
MNILSCIFGFFGEKNPKGMPSHLFFGSQRMDYSTAQRADITKQNYSVCPRHWYIDATFVCRDCADEFVFAADEQRFWYEGRRFWIDSLPTRCVGCRKEQRTRLNLRKRYDALIAIALGACQPETKKEVVAIINELEAAEDEIPEKMKQNRTVLYAQLAKAAS